MSDSANNESKSVHEESPKDRAVDRLVRDPYTRGLPEWDMFPTEQDRLRAIRDIERGMTPRTLWGLVVFVLIVLAVFVPSYFLTWVALEALAPSVPHRDLITFGIAAAIYTCVILFLIRGGMAKTLRKKLLKLGVPLCIKCGYDLRGLPHDRTNCPECGRPINIRVRKMLKPTTPLALDESRN